MLDSTEAAVSAPKPPAPLGAIDFASWGANAFDLSQWGLGPRDIAKLRLSGFDLPHWLVVPLLRAFRHCNTAADTLFYDVNLFWLRLFTRGITVTTADPSGPGVAQDSVSAMQAAAKLINLSSLADPEGVILVIDAHRAPFVERYDDVKMFLAEGLRFPGGTSADGATPKPVEIISVTGVGSSALGSAAFAWNISESLRKPVAAIVPGYGLADLIPQALGGWFGFGMHDFVRRWCQQILLQNMPEVATIGRHLSSTILGDEAFRSGSPESTVLHEILIQAPHIKRLYGHSKGALCIQNAVRGLPPGRYDDLHVTTFGCVVQEETAADYNQIMGNIDGLGQLNSWGNWPEQWIKSWHSTNSMLPLTMPIADLVKQDVRDEDPVDIAPAQLHAALYTALKQLLPPNLLAHA